jgi:hypothetical protein
VLPANPTIRNPLQPTQPNSAQPDATEPPTIRPEPVQPQSAEVAPEPVQPRSAEVARRVVGVIGSFAFVVATAIASGGIPGSRLHALVHDPGTAALPSDVLNPSGVIDVTVHSLAGAHPIAHARIRALAIIDERAYVADELVTDSDGRARLMHLPRGELWILADATAYARDSIQLVVDGAPQTVALVLVPGHAFQVALRDELGAALPAAEIEAIATDEPLPVGARTRADGTALVERLRPGPWSVTARATGYEDAAGRAERDGDVVRMTLRRLGAIDVHVQSDGDQAAPNARVSVAGATLWPPRAAETDGEGNVRIAGLSAGAYALRATKDSYASPIELDVPLGRGEEKSVHLRLGRGRFVGVRVTDGTGDDANPIASAHVMLAEGGVSPFPIEGTTDAHGWVHLGPIAPGPATIGAQADGFVRRGAMVVGDPPPVETRLVLVRAGILSGRVVDVRGNPIAGATVELVGTDVNGGPISDDPRRASFQASHFASMLAGPAPFLAAGELGVVAGPVPPVPLAITAAAMAHGSPLGATSEGQPWVTRKDGTFRATPASPGRVRAIVRHPEFLESQSDLVALAPGGESHVDVVMREGGALEGRVLDAHDRPVDGARVVISATSTTLERATRTASDGTFSFASAPAALSLRASARDDDAPEVRMNISVPEGGRQQVTVRLPEPRDPLPITVVDDRGSPIATAQITASSLSTDSLLRTTVFTGAEGQAAVRGARGIPLRVEVRAPSHAPRVLTTDTATDTLRVELAPGESATGEVVTASGTEPIPDAEVTVYTDLGARHTRTDARGAFTLTDLAAGPAQLRVRAEHCAPVDQAIAIPNSGGDRPYPLGRVALAGECVVEGNVVDGRGNPVVGARVARDRVPTWLRLGSNPQGLAITDDRGRFRLGELPEGTVTLEAYGPDVGRTRATVNLVAGRPNDEVHLTIQSSPDEGSVSELASSASLAVTLGETSSPVEVIVVTVVEGSEAERAGIAPGDVLLTVDGAAVVSLDDARTRLSGPAADDVLVTVRRGDRTLSLRVGREPVRR